MFGWFSCERREQRKQRRDRAYREFQDRQAMRYGGQMEPDVTFQPRVRPSPKREGEGGFNLWE